MAQERKYAAFISYRHVSPDKEIAKALQLMLEYNLVRPNKSAPIHIRKVFLDTSELPTLEDLDAGIIQALDQSECLFVICSPDLPKSKYCMREINYFKEIHGGSLDRVATILVRGEPQQAYPKALTTKTVPDPNDPSRSIEVDVEPLFADVRGKNLLRSLWKLFVSEYLRLAARYYRCTYDELKKRHKRNLIGAIACTVALVLAISGVLITKDQQVRITKANTYASYANEQTHRENELLAMALCTHSRCKATAPYTAALRSALLQFDYKRNSTPVSEVMETEYPYNGMTNYYLSGSGHQLLVADGHTWQVIDALHGTYIRQFPYESAFVLGTQPSAYIMLEARPDEAGVFRDYLQLFELETNRLITEFPFREAGNSTPKYHVRSLVESKGHLNMLMDGDQELAYFTADGKQLSREAYMALALSYTDGQAANSSDPFRIVQDKLHKEYAVKDQDGNLLLSLGSSYQNAAFSEDWKQFLWVADRQLMVYDTQSWTLLGQMTLEFDGPQTLQPLRNSSYLAVSFRQGGGLFGDGAGSAVIDWRSGKTLLTTEGTILISPTEQAFFTVVQGHITRYNYTPLDLTAQSEVVAQVGERCLSGQAGAWLLRNAQTGQTLLRSDCSMLCADEALEHILLADGQLLTLCDSSGNMRWQLDADATAIAIAPDAKRCAWLDGQGALHILDPADGKQLYTLTAAQVGQASQIVVSEQGVGVLGTQDSLWIRESDKASVSLGAFDYGTLFSDGILILESNARINDFAIHDTVNGRTFSPFDDNTGVWCYSPKTGYLVRHIQSSGNNPALYLQAFLLKDGKATLHGRIDLPEKYVDFLLLDSSGHWLSAASGGSTAVYDLEALSPVLNARCRVYFEADAFYGHTVFGDYQYTMPMHTPQQLLTLANDALTGPLGTRALTQEELKYYELSE